jgi:hypothetical protein
MTKTSGGPLVEYRHFDNTASDGKRTPGAPRTLGSAGSSHGRRVGERPIYLKIVGRESEDLLQPLPEQTFPAITAMPAISALSLLLCPRDASLRRFTCLRR